MLNKPHKNIKLHPFTEISLIVICVLIAEWAILPIFKNYLVVIVPVCIAFIIMFISHYAHGETLWDLGFRIDNFWQSLTLLIPPMLLATLFLIGIGWLFGSLRIGNIRPGWSLLWTYIGLFIWGLMQQYPLQGFINRRAQTIWGNRTRTTLFVAIVFALLHLPNLWLTLATFGGGLLWAWVYQRAPNLFTLALSHSIMTVVLVTTVPYSSLHGMRVGYGYFL
jgi:membrane protease YdiL (CAAX protease family)